MKCLQFARFDLKPRVQIFSDGGRAESGPVIRVFVVTSLQAGVITSVVSYKPELKHNISIMI